MALPMIAAELIKIAVAKGVGSLCGSSTKENEDIADVIIKETITPVQDAIFEGTKAKPWYKSTRNVGGWVTIILLMFNKKLGLDLSMVEITAITGLMGLLIGAKTLKN